MSVAFRYSLGKWFLFVVFGSFLWAIYLHFGANHSVQLPVQQVQKCDTDRPANWDKLYQWEDNLPQHNVNTSFPEGKNGRYVAFHNQIQQLGWNNLLNEILMNTYLAYKSNRAYVFQDYMWSVAHYAWKDHPERLPQPRMPLNALISGPSAGGPWESHDAAPRSISDRLFDQVCPPSERRIINTRDVKPAIYVEPSGKKIFDTWRKLLSEAPERCIEIQSARLDEDTFSQTFDLWFWGLGKANDFWEEFMESPVSRLWKTSPIVQSAVDRNEYLMQGREKVPQGASTDPYDRMLAIHIRRGDYEQACHNLAKYNSTFYSWNLLSFLPDRFPYPAGWDIDKEGTLKTYMTHCYPTEEFILEKIRMARQEYHRAAKPGEVRFLDTVYVLTNAKSEWIQRLTKVLRDDGWNHIVTADQLELDAQQKDAGMAVDMEFGRKAAVFIGNGWSSFTSNIVHRRIIDRRDPISMRFF